VQQFLLRCGVAAPVIYLLTVLLGGAITPGYSHARQVIGALTAPGTPHRQLLELCFLAYNVATLLFAFGLLWRLRACRRRNLTVGALLLAGVAICGIFMFFAPTDAPEGPATLQGQLSIALDAARSLLIFLSILVMGLGFRGVPGVSFLWGYSVVSAVLTGMAGLMAVAGSAVRSPLLGVYDRVAMGAFLLWMLVLALVLARVEPQPQPQPQPQPAPPPEEPEGPAEA